MGLGAPIQSYVISTALATEMKIYDINVPFCILYNFENNSEFYSTRLLIRGI